MHIHGSATKPLLLQRESQLRRFSMENSSPPLHEYCTQLRGTSTPLRSWFCLQSSLILAGNHPFRILRYSFSTISRDTQTHSSALISMSRYVHNTAVFSRILWTRQQSVADSMPTSTRFRLHGMKFLPKLFLFH